MTGTEILLFVSAIAFGCVIGEWLCQKIGL
jgi:hypothetical protein